MGVTNGRQADSDSGNSGRTKGPSGQTVQRWGRAIAAGRQAQSRLRQGGLSAAEQRRLEACVAAAEVAAGRLLESFAGLIPFVCRRVFHLVGLSEDVWQEGRLELLKAAILYNPDLGTHFSTYAHYRLRDAIRRALTAEPAGFRLPRGRQSELRRLRETETMLWQRLRRPPTAEEMSDELEWPLKKVMATQRLDHTFRSLDDRVVDGAELGDFVAEQALTPEEASARALLCEEVMPFVQALLPDERDVICLRFGLGASGRPHSREEIAEELGIPVDRVRQLELAALRRLSSRRLWNKVAGD